MPVEEHLNAFQCLEIGRKQLERLLNPALQQQREVAELAVNEDPLELLLKLLLWVGFHQLRRVGHI